MTKERHGEDIAITETSGGEKPNIMRYGLGISILLAIVTMTIIWITGTQFV